MAPTSGEFAAWLTQVMAERDLSARAVAARARVAGHDISHTSVAGIRRGTLPRTEKLVALAAGLGISVGEVLRQAGRSVESHPEHPALDLWQKLDDEQRDTWLRIGEVLKKRGVPDGKARPG